MKSDDRFDKLKESVMFNLSLSAKELFHSNFLSYLFNIEEKTLFGEITDIKGFVVKKAEREYKNIDIEITGEDGTKYLIENKVKDIITRRQLDEIQDKNKNYKTYFLFSLLGNNLQLLGEKPEKTKWKEISYKHIISILKNKIFKDDILNKMRDDYCDSMSIMISLLEEDYSHCDCYKLYNKNKRLEQYRNIRLHDVFQKYGISHFVNYFKKTYPNTDIDSTYGYSRNGIMTFSIKIKNDNYSVDIQIEDGQYRKSIVGKIENEIELLEKFESIGWFVKNWKSKRKKDYLGYDHKDKDKTKRWYQLQEIDQNIKEMSYSELAEKIKKDLDDVSMKINR